MLLRKVIITSLHLRFEIPTAVISDILSPVDVPLIATAATDSQLRTGSRDKFLLLPPSDAYQARAILDLLKYYDWMDISIFSSDTNYGIHGTTTIQQLLAEATADHTNSHEFTVRTYFFKAIDNAENIDLEDTLHIAVASLARVFVLHCEAKYAPVVIEQAHEQGLLDKGFSWIVTEGITSSPQSLLVDGYYPSYYEGLLGVSLYIDTTSAQYRGFKDDILAAMAGKQYISCCHLKNISKHFLVFNKLRPGNLTASDINPVVTATYDAIQMLGAALEMQTSRLSSSPSTCGQHTWDGGGKIFNTLVSNKHVGASGLTVT